MKLLLVPLGFTLLLVRLANADRPKCGLRPGSRIINGEDAEPHSWPWQVSLRYNGNHFCGASLISKDWVVTAAHCVDFFHLIDIDKITVVSGAHKLSDNYGVQISKVDQVHINPEWNSTTIQNDIALIKLATEAHFDNRVFPVCLPPKKPEKGELCSITGWGKTVGNANYLPDELQVAEVPIAKVSDCKKVYQYKPSNGGKIMFINATVHLCVGEGKVDTAGGCNGDSGGPLSCKIDDIYYWQGAVSFGMYQCPTTAFTVFSYGFHYRGWIQQITSIGPKGQGL